MELASLIEALSKLAWPLLIAFAFWKLLPAAHKLIESRNFKITVGVFELTVQEATEQLHKNLEDIQEKISQLRAEAPKRVPPSPSQETPTGTEPISRWPQRPPIPNLPRRILWVDDKPEDKAYYITQAISEDIKVTEVRSTQEAVDLVARERLQIGLVITSMGRWEDTIFKPEAGIDLIRTLRKADVTLPILAFTAKKKTTRYGDIVVREGADGITWSHVELFEMIHYFIPAAGVA